MTTMHEIVSDSKNSAWHGRYTDQIMAEMKKWMAHPRMAVKASITIDCDSKCSKLPPTIGITAISATNGMKIQKSASCSQKNHIALLIQVVVVCYSSPLTNKSLSVLFWPGSALSTWSMAGPPIIYLAHFRLITSLPK